MAKKLTYEEVKSFIEVESGSGYKLISSNYENSKAKIEIECDKGHKFLASYSNFKKGSRCPDCHNKNRIIHGLSRNPLYNTYTNMIDRCYNPQNESYPNYGNRGIKVCDKWLDKDNYNGLKDFIEWGIKNGYKKGLSIERIDVDGDYCPENCTFITMEKQQANKQSTRYITINGETKHLLEWERISGLGHTTILRRLNTGWNSEELLKNPTTQRAEKQSGIVGITWNKNRKRWKVLVGRNFLGWYKNISEAKRVHKDFCNRNNIEIIYKEVV